MKRYKCNECGGNCMGCFYTDLCDKWLDESPYEPYYEVSDHASMALCEGRHSIPQAVDGAIFGNTINPLDTQGLQAEAESKLKALDIKSLDLYVTGLTVALVAVLNTCRQLGIVVTLYHYDRESDNYYPQQVL